MGAKHRCPYHQAPVDCSCVSTCLRHNKPLGERRNGDSFNATELFVRELLAGYEKRAKELGTKRSQTVTPIRETRCFDVV